MATVRIIFDDGRVEEVTTILSYDAEKAVKQFKDQGRNGFIEIDSGIYNKTVIDLSRVRMISSIQ